jgi:hypothetical protein
MAMGDLIRLRPRHGATPETTALPNSASAREGGATILLFTGVRYERHDEGDAKTAKRPTGRGGRRRRA